jgi:hypothetical protein
VPSSKPIETLIDELDEAFIRVTRLPKRALPVRMQIGWVHPSYRDLVIDFLRKDRIMRLRYLERGGMPAFTLALSQDGGATGDRFSHCSPTRRVGEHYERARWRLFSTNRKTTRDQYSLSWTALCLPSPPNHDQLISLAGVICETVRNKWNDSGAEIQPENLKQFFDLAEIASFHVVSPDLENTWELSWDRARQALYGDSTERLKAPEEFVDWAELLMIIETNEPRYLRRVGFQAV